MFGAGGAARAIGVEVALAGATKITVVNRSVERGEELTKLLNDKVPAEADFAHWQGTFDIPKSTDVVINATSIGLFPDVDARVDFNPDSLTPDMVVADVIPNPPLTNLVKDARKGLQSYRRPRHARESGGYRDSILDGCGPRSCRHASCLGRSFRVSWKAPFVVPHLENPVQ